jgi:hypothetical protein
MWYLILTNPNRDTITYELGEDAIRAAELVPAAKAHAGFPHNAPLESEWTARLAPYQAAVPADGEDIEGVIVPGTLVRAALDQVAGAAYAAAEAAAAQAGARTQATAALAQLDAASLRAVLLDMAASLDVAEALNDITPQEAR